MRTSDVCLTLLASLAPWVYRRWRRLRDILFSINYHAGYRSLFDCTSIKPSVFGLSPEKTITWAKKHEPFKKFGCDIISAVSWLPYPTLSFFVADASAVKEITFKRWKYPKHMEEYEVFKMFGNNLVAIEGQEWKRHRRICAPSYSEKTNQFVWNESCRILSKRFERFGDRFVCENVSEFTRLFALEVISITGFGVRFEQSKAYGAHKMSFAQALEIIAKDGAFKLALPSWAMQLTSRFRRADLAFSELWDYLRELVVQRSSKGVNAEGIPERLDLFSGLLRANENSEGSIDYLTQDEFFGNIFIGFFAGHETTACTLAFTLILLARYPEIQEDLHRHITSILKGQTAPEYTDRSLFSKTTAVIYETLRMYPPVTGYPKYANEDTILSCATGDFASTRINVPIPKGSKVIIDVPGLHYNEKYWERPYEWDPSRFERDWDENAFIPFSLGARACIGRSFFETESTAVITMLVANYRIETLDSSKGASIPVHSSLTLAPPPFPLVFTRRESPV
ncbi:614/534 cytochrome P450 [Phlebopus sp. FC_14]|nr:614/534 cytochrome P450 [Phlebopus sp. FC_14]